MRVVSLLIIVLILAVMAAEVVILIKVMHAVDDVLGPIFAIVILSFIGFKVMGYHIRRLPQSVMSGTAGRRMVGLFGGLLLALPGFLTAALGLLLQIGLIQRVFARVAQRIATALARGIASNNGRFKAFSNLGPGFGAAGFGLGATGMFPGMTPDDRVRGPRTYDTKALRDDEPKP